MENEGYDNENDPDERDDDDQDENEGTPLVSESRRGYDKRGARPKEKVRKEPRLQVQIGDQDPTFKDSVPEYFDKTEYNGVEYYFGGRLGEEAKKEFIKVYPEMDGKSTKVKFGISNNGSVVVSLNRAGQNRPYNIDYETGTTNKGGNLEFPDGIKKVLGKRAQEISLENFKQIDEEKKKKWLIHHSSRELRTK